jgi:seryl-tRNA synthetase
MLDIREVRKDTQAVAEALAVRGFCSTASLRALDARRKAADVQPAAAGGAQECEQEDRQLISEGMSVDEAKASVEATLRRDAAEIDDADARRGRYSGASSLHGGCPTCPMPRAAGQGRGRQRCGRVGRAPGV